MYEIFPNWKKIHWQIAIAVTIVLGLMGAAAIGRILKHFGLEFIVVIDMLLLGIVLYPAYYCSIRYYMLDDS